MAYNHRVEVLDANRRASPGSLAEQSRSSSKTSSLRNVDNYLTNDYTWSRSLPIIFNTRRTYVTRPPPVGSKSLPPRTTGSSAVFDSYKDGLKSFPLKDDKEDLDAKVYDLEGTNRKLEDELSIARSSIDAEKAKAVAAAKKPLEEKIHSTTQEMKTIKEKEKQKLQEREEQARQKQKTADDAELRKVVAAKDRERERLAEQYRALEVKHIKEKESSEKRVAELEAQSLERSKSIEAARQRRTGRQNYDSYHAFFDRVLDTWDDCRLVFDFSVSISKSRLHTDEQFRQDWTEFATEGSWISTTRAGFHHSVMQHINKSILESKQVLEVAEEVRQSLKDNIANHRTDAHHSRQTTKILRLQPAPSRYDVAKVANTPITELQHRNSQLIPEDFLNSVIFKEWKAYESDLQMHQSLTALLSDSAAVKSAFLAVEDILNEYIKARNKFWEEFPHAENQKEMKRLYTSKRDECLNDLDAFVQLHIQMTLLAENVGELSEMVSMMDEEIRTKIAALERKLQARVRKFKSWEVPSARWVSDRPRSLSEPPSIDQPQESQSYPRSVTQINSELGKLVASKSDRKALKDDPKYKILQVELWEAKSLIFGRLLEDEKNSNHPSPVRIQDLERNIRQYRARIEKKDMPARSSRQGVEENPVEGSAPSRDPSSALSASRSASPRFRIRQTIGRASVPRRRRYSCYARMTESTVAGEVNSDFSWQTQQQQNVTNEDHILIATLSPAYLDVSSSTEPAATDEQSKASVSGSGSSIADEQSDIGDSVVERHLPAVSFQIPEDVMQAAQKPTDESAVTYWSYLLYRDEHNKTPARHYCKNFQRAEEQAASLLAECTPGSVLGFDLEWVNAHEFPGKSTIKRNVSLIQLATESKCLLFHVAVFVGDSIDDLMPPSLRKVLESPTIVKAGVNVAGDATRLRTNMNVHMKGLFELSQLYNVVKYSETAPELVNKKFVKMETQVLDVLRLPLDKTQSVRAGDWSHTLSTQQTDYACSDAYAGFHLYHALNAERMKMSPAPPMPAFQELRRPLLLANGKPAPRVRRVMATGVSKTEEVEDEEGEEEYFDAVEEQESEGEVETSSKVDEVVYPDLPHSSGVATNEARVETPSLKVLESSATSPPAHDTTDPSTALYLQQADDWISNLRRSFPAEHKLRAENHKQSTLRAYHLWYEQGHDIKSTAALLRTPPLALTTVASYVMEAIREADLPYCLDRIREPLAVLPQAARLRYRRIIERVELAQR